MLGSTVVVKDMEFGDEETYTIVGTTEADPSKNRISNESPVGAAILGALYGLYLNTYIRFSFNPVTMFPIVCG